MKVWAVMYEEGELDVCLTKEDVDETVAKKYDGRVVVGTYANKEQTKIIYLVSGTMTLVAVLQRELIGA